MPTSIDAKLDQPPTGTFESITDASWSACWLEERHRRRKCNKQGKRKRVKLSLRKFNSSEKGKMYKSKDFKLWDSLEMKSSAGLGGVSDNTE
jgi:hypothetical protein